MQHQKPVANFGARLLVAVFTVIGGSLILFATSMIYNALSGNISYRVSAQPDMLITMNIISLAGTVLGALVAGFSGGSVGWRKLSLIGGVVMGASAIWLRQIGGIPGLAFTQFGMAVGEAMVTVSVVALLLAVVGTPWLLASVAALYLAVTEFAAAVTQFSAYVEPTLSVVLGVVIGGLGLASGGFSYVLSLSLPYTWRAAQPGSAPDKVQPAELTLMLVAVFLIGWAATSVGFLDSYATDHLGLPTSEVSTAIGALVAVLGVIAFCPLLAGPVADVLDWLTVRYTQRRWGRTFVAVSGMAVLCTGLGTLLMAGNAQGLTNALIMTRLGLGVLGPALLALVIATMPAHVWGAAVGLYLAVNAAGYMGHIAMRLAVDEVGPASPFVLGLALSALAVILVAGGPTLWAMAVKAIEPEPATD
jgi:hypothetical protein